MEQERENSQKCLRWGEMRPHHQLISQMLSAGANYGEIALKIHAVIGKNVPTATFLNYARRQNLRQLSPIYRPVEPTHTDY